MLRRGGGPPGRLAARPPPGSALKNGVTAVSTLRFRRSPHLVTYWRGRAFVIHNYATGAQVSADALTCALLDGFDDWRPAGALAARFPEFTPASLRAAVTKLARHSLLQRSDARPDPRERALETWTSWNPSAGLFHFSTKDVRFNRDPARAERALRRDARTHPMPAAVKRYPRRPQVVLPPGRTDGEFARVLLARRTWQRFSRARVDLAALATLLDLTWGVQGWLRGGAGGPAPKKTSPSGGARHPIEVYVAARRVRGLRPGLYHYAADRHRLELLKPGATPRRLTTYLPGQRWYGGAAAVMLMTAVFPREQWRYPFPRAYRVVLLDAGHLCQTFCLVATWLGLAPFCTAALADSRIERDLGLDGVTESVIYAAGVGVRPRPAARI